MAQTVAESQFGDGGIVKAKNWLITTTLLSARICILF
jgi:hypothetical protein